MIVTDWSQYRHFDPESDSMLACPCCGACRMDMRFMDKLEFARMYAAVPFSINSGGRCPSHDRDVHREQVEDGTYTGTSSHISNESKPSCACDIAADSTNRYQVVRGLLTAGFTRLGIAKTFIHVDDDVDKAPEVIWLYCDGERASSRWRYRTLRSAFLDMEAVNLVLGRESIQMEIVSRPSLYPSPAMRIAF